MFNLDLLYWIDLNITDLCNLRCSFCPRSDAELWPNRNIHMPLDMIKFCTDDLIKNNYKGLLSYTGRGESTLHEDWSQAFAILNRPDRTYQSHATHNCVQIKRFWKDLRKLDSLTLNVYTNEKDLANVKEKYSKLDNGRDVKIHFKPDGVPFEELLTEYGFYTANRTGMKQLIATDSKINNPCLHPIHQIFINFDGTYELCCNDWNYQTKIDNIEGKGIIDIYLNNVRLNRARWNLLNGNRTCESACADCDVGWTHQTLKSLQQDNKLSARLNTTAPERISLI
jgi:hypothetical protein